MNKPTPLQIVVIVVCLGGFSLALYAPLADSFDRMFPTREQVGAFADASAQLSVAVEAGSADSEHIRHALEVLPAKLVHTLNAFGGKVIITEVDPLQELHSQGTPLAHTAGLYLRTRRTAYVANDTNNPGQTALHEIGHMLDHALGDASQTASFSTVFESARSDSRLGAGWRDKPQEFSAEFFARYYFSDRRRAWLRQRFPLAHEYFAALEREALSR